MMTPLLLSLVLCAAEPESSQYVNLKSVSGHTAEVRIERVEYPHVIITNRQGKQSRVLLGKLDGPSLVKVIKHLHPPAQDDLPRDDEPEDGGPNPRPQTIKVDYLSDILEPLSQPIEAPNELIGRRKFDELLGEWTKEYVGSLIESKERHLVGNVSQSGGRVIVTITTYFGSGFSPVEASHAFDIDPGFAPLIRERTKAVAIYRLTEFAGGPNRRGLPRHGLIAILNQRYCAHTGFAVGLEIHSVSFRLSDGKTIMLRKDAPAAVDVPQRAPEQPKQQPRQEVVEVPTLRAYYDSISAKIDAPNRIVGRKLANAQAAKWERDHVGDLLRVTSDHYLRRLSERGGSIHAEIASEALRHGRVCRLKIDEDLVPVLKEGSQVTALYRLKGVRRSNDSRGAQYLIRVPYIDAYFIMDFELQSVTLKLTNGKEVTINAK